MHSRLRLSALLSNPSNVDQDCSFGHSGSSDGILDLLVIFATRIQELLGCSNHEPQCLLPVVQPPYITQVR